MRKQVHPSGWKSPTSKDEDMVWTCMKVQEDFVCKWGNIMPIKLKYEYVEDEFKKHGLTLLTKVYKNNQTKMLFQNNDGYKSVMSYGNLSCGKNPQYFSKFNPYTIENISRFLLNNNTKTKIVSKAFISSDSELEFICECGKHFVRSWSKLQQQKYKVCYDCATKYRGLTRLTPFYIVKKTFEDNGLSLISTQENYKSRNTYLECFDKNGYRGFQSYGHVLSGRRTVIKFNIEKNSVDNVIYNLNLWASKNNIKSRCIGLCDTGKWSQQGITCVCDCGNIFNTSIPSYMNGKDRCAHCTSSISKIELLTMDWLDNNNIKYIEQYRFDDCKDVLPLPFDFYIPSFNMIIEVDGEGHYSPTYFNQCSYEDAKETFIITQKHDDIKNKYCERNNIKLLRIPYWEYKTDNYIKILHTNLIKE